MTSALFASFVTLLCAAPSLAIPIDAGFGFYDRDAGNLGDRETTGPACAYYMNKYTIHVEDKTRFQRSTGRGKAMHNVRCDRVSAVPRSVKKSMDLSDFYEKYTHAYGVPIISSKEVPDKAIRRACYVVQVMLADRQDIRDSVYNSYGRIGIIGFLQNTTDVPEHDFLDEYYNTRARGLGGTMYAPISTAGEENILCYPKDSYHDEDILVHEFAHGIHRLGLEPIDDTFTPKLLASFEDARNRGLWNHTYAATNSQEYLAKGVQIYFNVNGVPFKGIDNQVNTRAKLRRYDRKLYKLVREIFPCGNEIIDRCFHAECSDQDVEENCRIWKGDNECETNPKYMITHCKRTCNICDFGGRGYPGDKPHMNCQSDQNSTPQLKLNKVKKVNNKKSKNRKNNLTKASDTFKEVSNTIKLSNKLEHQQGQRDCVDDHPECPIWAEAGGCESNPTMMLNECKESCEMCTSVGGCVDFYPDCAYWSSFSQCWSNPTFMWRYCRQSCGLCDDCSDRNRLCSHWARIGQCDVNPSYMGKICRRSCGICTRRCDVGFC